MHESLEYIFYHLDYKTVKDLLDRMSPQFSPSLSCNMDLDSYAEKLATNATFLLCKSSDLVVGAIVFYPNSSTSIIYIPLVWVDNDWRGQRIAKNMFMSLLQYGDSNKFKNIDLEVLKSNKEARCLYSSLGFSILEDRQSKFLLRLPLSNKDEKNE